MRYYIKIMFLLEKKNLLNIFIDVLCLSLGVLIGIVFLSQASTAYENIELNQRYMPMHDYWLYEPEAGARKIQVLELKEIKERNIGVIDIQVYGRQETGTMIWHEDSFCPGMSVWGVTEGYFHIFESDYLVGENISDLQSAVIGKNAAERYGITVGDKIEIENNSFFVTGILQVPEYSNTVLVRIETMEEAEVFDCRYYVSALEENRKDFVRFLEKNYGVYAVYSAEENVISQKERLSSGWTFSIIIAVIMICYGLVNIFNVERFFILKQKKAFAVIQALGGMKQKLILVKLLRALLIAWFSTSITALMVLGLEHTELGYLLEFHVTGYVYLGAFLLIAVIYILFSYGLYQRHYGKDISKIISEI